jgi:hypothetical protein
MILCKIQNNLIDDVHVIFNGKYGQKYPGVEVESMKKLTEAYSRKSIV